MQIIPQKIIPEQYVCDICGRISTNKNQIIECESRGRPTSLVQEGDVIWFKDCEETPIYHNYINDKSPQIGIRENYQSYMSYLCSEERQIYKHITTSYLVGSKLNEWIVGKIEIIRHDIKYYMVTKLGGGNFSYSHDNYFNLEWEYPVIESNDIMLKILNLYNKR